jgi:hypothetical protein
MDLEVLKKKLSTYKNSRGQVRGVNDDLLLEVLSEWEHWTGSAKEFYKSIGISSTGMASMIGKAKRLKREGHSAAFEEVKVEGFSDLDNPTPITCDIEVQDKNKIIRFRKVDLLIEYLKKAA